MQHPEQVHWHDGLFMLPHHLQYQQHAWTSAAASERRGARAFASGVAELEIDGEALARHVVAISRLEAVLPSGRLVRLPGNAVVPTLDVRGLFEENPEPAIVFLALPESSASEANVIEGDDRVATGSKRPYRVVERTWRDENDAESEEPLLLRQYNARLVTDRDDHADLELLPLARLKPVADDPAEVLPRHDEDYAPPTLRVAAVAPLRTLHERLVQQLLTRRDELVVEIERIGYSAESLSGVLLEKVLRLRSISAYAGRLDGLRQDPTFSPFELYLAMRELAGELSALAPGRGFLAPLPYQHDDCLPGLRELARRIANLAVTSEGGTYIKLPLESLEPGRVWATELRDEHLLVAEEYYLAAHAPGAGSEVARLVGDGDRFKLTARSLKEARVRGVRLREERRPPTVLPALADTLWFRLAREENPRLWSRLRDEQQLVVVCPQTVPTGFALNLFLTCPARAGATVDGGALSAEPRP